MGPFITLTTDFGTGTYVAQVRGVILSLLPEARVEDLCHAIGPGDVREAAYVLETVVPAYPEGSVHLCVVDPGVGGPRRAIAAAFAGRMLVGPDNGVFTAFLPRADEVREITNTALFLPEVSATFHGRDLFAPVAAQLAGGLPLPVVGPVLAGPPVLLPDLRATGDAGVVLHVDRFGNLVTSFASKALEDRPAAALAGPGGDVTARARTFCEAEGDRPFLYAGSGGRIEVAVNGGSAASSLGWGRGTAVALREVAR
jgi:S-adenosylmethionine hydrolase